MPTLSFWQRLSSADDLAFDVAVVGGGIAGVSTAYWLRRLRPGARVALVEAQNLAHGASGRNAGFLLQGAGSDYALDVQRHGRETARRLWSFTRENRDLLLSELDPSAFGFEPAGSLVAAGTSEEAARLRAAVPLLRSDGFPAAYLAPADLHRRIQGQGFFGGLYVTSGGTLDPAALVRHIAARSGATVLEHHQVAAVGQWGRRFMLETRVRRVVADRVVLALNAYAPQLMPALASFVRPVRAQMLATAREGPRWLSQPVYSHEGYFYIRQHPSGSVLLGGARHLHVDEEVGYGDVTTAALQEDLEAYLRRHFPHVTAPVERRWSGVMGFSPDGLPVIGGVPGMEGAYFACGFTGHGMAYGFRAGRLLAEQVWGLPAAEADLFDPARLAAVPRA